MKARCTVLAISLFVGVVLHPSLAVAQEVIDTARQDISRKKSEARWDLLFSKMPDEYTGESLIERTKSYPQMDVESASFADQIAAELLYENESSVLVLRFVNETVLPFLRSNREHYLCVWTAYYYGSTIPTDEILGWDKTPMTILFEYAYIYASTSEVGQKIGVRVPSDSAELISSKGVKELQANGWIDPRLGTSLDCAQFWHEEY